VPVLAVKLSIVNHIFAGGIIGLCLAIVFGLWFRATLLADRCASLSEIVRVGCWSW